MSRKERKAEYEKILGIIRHNTGGRQPAGLRRPQICVQASHADMDPGTVKSRLQAAIESGDVIRWEGRDGKPRYTVAEIGELRNAIAEITTWDEPDRETIGQINREIENLK